MARAREVGLREVIGADRSQVVRQFFGESTLLAFLALILGGILARLFLPTFNTLAQTQFVLDTSTAVSIVPGLTVLILAVGLLAGLYPAAFLSAYQPVEVFRKSRTKSSWFRQGLVVFQFALSIALIVGSGMVERQIDYMTNKKLGFDTPLTIEKPEL